MAGGEQPLVGDERGSALEVAVAVERRLPGPGARRRAAAAHHPAPPHALVSYTPTQHTTPHVHRTPYTRYQF